MLVDQVDIRHYVVFAEELLFEGVILVFVEIRVLQVLSVSVPVLGFSFAELVFIVLVWRGADHSFGVNCNDFTVTSNPPLTSKYCQQLLNLRVE